MAAAAVIIGLFAAPTSSAEAASPGDGLWYYDVFHVQDAHNAGLTGAGVTIAVVDGQLNPDVPELADADIEVQHSSCVDESGAPISATTADIGGAFHGTNVTSLIVGNGIGYPGQIGVKGIAPQARVLFFSTGPADRCIATGSNNDDSVAFGGYVDAAVAAGADIISVSLLVPSSKELELAIARAEHEGVVVVGGLANELFGDLDQSGFPGTANGVVSVQAIDANGDIQTTDGQPNVNPFTDVVAPGVGILSQGDESAGVWQDLSIRQGTSFATPTVAGFLALVKQKYPDASGNQLIQSLIRNTGVEDHELGYDAEHKYGYGSVSLTHMLANDPTQYDDSNPLVDSSDGASGPSAATIANPPSLDDYLAQSSEHTPASDSDAQVPGSSSLLGWLLVGIVGLLIVAVVVAIIVVAARRVRRMSRAGVAP